MAVQLAHLVYARRTDVRAARAEERDRVRFERETKPKLWVRPFGGMSGDGSDHVSVLAEIGNDGGVASREAVVAVLVDGEVVGASEPVDVEPGAAVKAKIGRISREHIVSIHGSGWNFRGGYGARVRDRDGFEAAWPPLSKG